MIRAFALVTVCAAFCVGCDDGYLRGAVEPSKDGRTYFALADYYEGACGQVLLDGERWQHPLGEVAPISPGKHTINCGGEISFEIPPGVVFRFDYWGP